MSSTSGSAMKTPIISLAIALAIALAAASVGDAALASFDRLSADVLDVVPPSARVSGAPGEMTIEQGSCRIFPAYEVRRRIVNVAVQEWGFFGFRIVDQTSPDGADPGAPRSLRRPPRLGAAEAVRVADSIAGYWTVTPDGRWILDRQNRAWNGPSGAAARWRDPWSAAFVSWVMCEGGLGDSSRFRHAIAHYIYIDQAIRARDKGESGTAFAAYDVGEADIEPGDLLCTARRAAYRTLDERRRHLGASARTHCDIVVKVDAVNERIFAIGGNVRGSVRLKLLPAVRVRGEALRPLDQSTIPGGRTVFAHLKLRADPIEANALDNSPTLKALGERDAASGWLQQATAARVSGGRIDARLWPVTARSSGSNVHFYLSLHSLR